MRAVRTLRLGATRFAHGAIMRRTGSIRVRLSSVFLFLFALVVLLGVFGIGSLSYLNAAAAQVRDRSLPSTRVLGDLNNLTSDFRAAEAARLLVADASERAASEREMRDLDQGIAAAQRGYEHIEHGAEENALYAQFAAKWNAYRHIVQQAQSVAPGFASEAAVGLFKTRSKIAYDAASDTLGLLTDQNVANAREASVRADLAYTRVRWLIVLTIVIAGLLVASAMTYVRRWISEPLL